MLKGLYAAASAMLANLNQQSILSHDLSNLETPGFREVLTRLQPWETTSVASSPMDDPAQRARLLGELGLGVEPGDTASDFTQGPLEQTSQPLDLAINGTGFFTVQTPQGTRYTRDGRFERDANGQLVTVDGYKVLDANGAPLSLADGQVAIGPNGQITVDGTAAGKLGVANFANPTTDLTRDPQAGNLFVAGTAPAGGSAGTVQQGYLEMSNVDVSQIMTEMVSVGRAYEAAQRMVQAQDTLLGQSINSLGSWS